MMSFLAGLHSHRKPGRLDPAYGRDVQAAQQADGGGEAGNLTLLRTWMSRMVKLNLDINSIITA